VSGFADDFAAVVSQEELGEQALEQQRTGTRPVDQEMQARKPQSASAPASRPRRVIQDSTRLGAGNSEISRERTLTWIEA
jgi:hypothetical protein